MSHYRVKISSLILFLILVTAFTTYSWGAGSITVQKKVGCAACNSNDPSCSIQTAIENNYDTIYVKPSDASFASTACPSYEPITITKAITLVGLTSSGQQAWTSGSPGGSSGPTIKYDSSHDHIVKIQSGNVK